MKNLSKKDLFLYGGISLFVAMMFQSGFLFFLIVLAMIWMYPSKGEHNFIDRIKKISQHKKRIAASVIPILVIIGSLLPNTSVPEVYVKLGDNIKKEAENTYKIDDVATTYKLNLVAKNTKKIIIHTDKKDQNQVELVGSGENFIGDISLPNQQTTVWATAIGDTEKTISFSIVRKPTAEEEVAFQKYKAEQEQKALELKKKREEAEKASKKEQAVIDSKVAAIKKKYESLCRNGYLYEIEARLFKNDFTQDSSGFEKSPDGSTQVATHYSKIEGDFEIKIRLQSAYDISSHWYNVDVTYIGIKSNMSQDEKDYPDYHYCMNKYRELGNDQDQKETCDKMLSYLKK